MCRTVSSLWSARQSGPGRLGRCIHIPNFPRGQQRQSTGICFLLTPPRSRALSKNPIWARLLILSRSKSISGKKSFRAENEGAAFELTGLQILAAGRKELVSMYKNYQGISGDVHAYLLPAAACSVMMIRSKSGAGISGRGTSPSSALMVTNCCGENASGSHSGRRVSRLPK